MGNRTEEKEEIRFDGRKRHTKVYELTQIALMSAVLCVIAPISIPVPLGLVPVTLGTFSIYLAAALLGAKKGTVSVLLYLLLGAVGLPVFSGFTGGFTVLFGPTGGYLLGYLSCTFIIGWMTEKSAKRGVVFLSMALGTCICYVCGTAWLAVMLKLSVTEAFFAGVAPYLMLDTVKILIAGTIATPIKAVLNRTMA